jgi:hypothetical protein
MKNEIESRDIVKSFSALKKLKGIEREDATRLWKSPKPHEV